jgi:hypothetical protein
MKNPHVQFFEVNLTDIGHASSQTELELQTFTETYGVWAGLVPSRQVVSRYG